VCINICFMWTQYKALIFFFELLAIKNLVLFYGIVCCFLPLCTHLYIIMMFDKEGILFCKNICLYGKRGAWTNNHVMQHREQSYDWLFLVTFNSYTHTLTKIHTPIYSLLCPKWERGPWGYGYNASRINEAVSPPPYGLLTGYVAYIGMSCRYYTRYIIWNKFNVDTCVFLIYISSLLLITILKQTKITLHLPLYVHYLSYIWHT
jgi:hypothetical protein